MIEWKVDSADNVAVVAQPVRSRDVLEVGAGKLTANSDIPTGHKIALCDIAKGDMVIKYGVPIGKASEDIRTGDYVHTHNVEDITTALCEAYAAEYRRKAAQS